MANLEAKFNDGVLTSDTIDRQFNDEFVTKAVVEMPKRKIVFSKHSNRVTMPKNSGDKLSREVDYGMLDDRNMIDGNIDASTALLQSQDVFYVVNADGSVDSTYDVQAYLTSNTDTDIPTARAAAKAAAVAAASGTQVVKSGSNGIVNGDTEYTSTAGPIASLPETGGVVNLLSHSSKMVEARITFHGIGHKFTMRSVDLDSRKGLIARKIKHVGEAVANLKEMQVRHDLLTYAQANAILPANTTIATLDHTDILDMEVLDALEQQLLAKDVPMDTEILSGVDLVDTKTVDEGWIVYVNNEVLPTLRKITGPGGALVWEPVRTYAASKMTLDGEQGAIGPFRFVTVKDMDKRKGAGADATANGAGFKTTIKNIGGTPAPYFDVYTALVVGDDSFSIAGFGSNNTSASYIPPVKDNFNDMHGENAGISAKWSYGMLVYRPERITGINFTVKVNG